MKRTVRISVFLTVEMEGLDVLNFFFKSENDENEPGGIPTVSDQNCNRIHHVYCEDVDDYNNRFEDAIRTTGGNFLNPQKSKKSARCLTISVSF